MWLLVLLVLVLVLLVAVLLLVLVLLVLVLLLEVLLLLLVLVAVSPAPAHVSIICVPPSRASSCRRPRWRRSAGWTSAGAACRPGRTPPTRPPPAGRLVRPDRRQPPSLRHRHHLSGPFSMQSSAQFSALCSVLHPVLHISAPLLMMAPPCAFSGRFNIEYREKQGVSST